MERAETAMRDARPMANMASEARSAGDNQKAMAMKEEMEWRVRSKPWVECSIEEKLEKLRIAERETQRALSYITTLAVRAHDLAKVHQHSHNGEVLKPANDRLGGDAVCGSSQDTLA